MIGDGPVEELMQMPRRWTLGEALNDPIIQARLRDAKKRDDFSFFFSSVMGLVEDGLIPPPPRPADREKADLSGRFLADVAGLARQRDEEPRLLRLPKHPQERPAFPRGVRLIELEEFLRRGD
jgi:hypothetical protein